MRFEDYPVSINPLPEEDGGGFLVILPDLPGCMADGDTVEEAIAEDYVLSLKRPDGECSGLDEKTKMTLLRIAKKPSAEALAR